MAKKHQKRQNRHVHPQSPFEALMMSKKAALVKAEREYWSHRRKLLDQQARVADMGLWPVLQIPSDVSSLVWALRDGAAFVRYKTVGTAGVGFRICDMTLEEWGTKGLILPIKDGEISLAQAGVFGGIGHFTLINCRVNGAEIPYADFSVMRYGDSQSLPSVANAVADFQLALLGQLFQDGRGSAQLIEQRSVLAKIEDIALKFEELLAAIESREEELQRFVRDNPLMIHASAAFIPKQKLGEDFVTDFVLIVPLEQGPKYYLVEIERASFRLFMKDGSFSPQVNHAIKQTRDWDIWLENNQAYLKGRLDGFESPQYLIIIGRGNTLSLQEKAYLRSHNRDWKNTELLTYDDLLAQFKATIARLREATQA